MIFAFLKKRIGVVSEISGNDVDPLKLKKIAGHERITARKNFEDYQSFFNYCKLLICVNEFPKIKGSTGFAFWRRVIVVSFDFVFVNQPKTKKEKKKNSNDEKILQSPAKKVAFIKFIFYAAEVYLDSTHLMSK